MFRVLTGCLVVIALLASGCSSTGGTTDSTTPSGDASPEGAFVSPIGPASQPKYYREPSGPWGTGNDPVGNRTEWDNPDAPPAIRSAPPPAEVSRPRDTSGSSSSGSSMDFGSGGNTSSGSGNSGSGSGWNNGSGNSGSSGSGSGNSGTGNSGNSGNPGSSNTGSGNTGSGNNTGGSGNTGSGNTGGSSSSSSGAPSWFKNREAGSARGLYGFAKGSSASAASDAATKDLQGLVEKLVRKYFNDVEAPYDEWADEIDEAVERTVLDLAEDKPAADKQEEAGGQHYVRVTYSVAQIAAMAANTLSSFWGFSDAPETSDVREALDKLIDGIQK